MKRNIRTCKYIFMCAQNNSAHQWLTYRGRDKFMEFQLWILFHTIATRLGSSMFLFNVPYPSLMTFMFKVNELLLAYLELQSGENTAGQLIALFCVYSKGYRPLSLCCAKCFVLDSRLVVRDEYFSYRKSVFVGSCIIFEMLTCPLDT